MTLRRSINTITPYFVFILLYVLAYPAINEFISSNIVASIFQKIKPSIVNDLIIIAFAIIIGCWYLSKLNRRYIQSTKLYLSSLTLTILYLFIYRINGYFTLYHFSAEFLSPFYYLDIVCIPFLFGSILYIAQLCHKKNDKENASSFFLNDEPIKNIEDDILSRKEIAEVIAETIAGVDSEKAVAIGIQGEWGIGKTSLFNLIDHYLNTDKYLSVTYRPWSTVTKNDLIAELFESVAEVVKAHSQTLPNMLHQYSSSLIDDSGFSFSNTIRSLLGLSQNDLHTQFTQINNTLQKLGKKVIIYVDDIDRIEPQQIPSVLQLIKNTANFNHFIFLVAYDKAYITNSLESLNYNNPSKYLEKIFITDFALPPVDIDNVKHYLEKSFIDKLGIESDTVKAALYNNGNTLILLERDCIDNHLKNLRDAKRLFNLISTSYSEVDDEINFRDLLVVEILRMKYPKLFYHFKDSPLEFIEPVLIGNGNSSVYALKKTSDSDNTPVISAFLNKNHEDFIIPFPEIENVLKLSESLFPDPRFYYEDRNVNSIIWPEHYNKYFNKRLAPNDLSSKEFNKYYKEPHERLLSQIDIWHEQGKTESLVSRLEKIRLKDISTSQEYKVHIKALIKLGRYINPKSISGVISGEGLINKLMLDRNALKTYFDGDKTSFKKFVFDIFSQAPSPYIFDVSTLHLLSEKSNLDSFILSPDEINALRIKYLSYTLDQSPKISDNIWNIYHSNDVTTWIPEGSNSRRSQTEKNPEAKKLLREFFETKDVEGLLHVCITYTRMSGTKYAISQGIAEIYGSYQNFHDYINTLSEEEYPAVVDVKGLLNKMKEVDYKKYVDFTFEVMKEKNIEDK